MMEKNIFFIENQLLVIGLLVIGILVIGLLVIGILGIGILVIGWVSFPDDQYTNY